MSFELRYTITDNGGISVNSRTATPKGLFSLVTTRENHRYREEMSGTMMFVEEDFDWIMAAGKCTEIQVICQFHKEWKGVFTHADCTIINISKRFIEVTPRPDDEYRKFLPWIRQEMNIVPPYNGINSKVRILTLNQYELERRTVRIEEPYTSTGSENWVGYSVNDGIKVNGNYTRYDLDLGRRNSLIHYLNNNIPSGINICGAGGRSFTSNYIPWFRYDWSRCPADTEGPYFLALEGSDQDNQLLWMDYSGYELKIGEGDLRDYFAFYRRSGGLFTLVEVINFYDDDDNWEYCDLIYEREVYRGPGEPPSGNISASQDLQYGRIRGWVYSEDEQMWIRRPLNAFADVYPFTNPESLSDFNQVQFRTRLTGDGTWYSQLADVIIDGKKAKKQELIINRKMQDEHGANWYLTLYGQRILNDHYHRIDLLLQKFIEFLRDSGTRAAGSSVTKDDIVSRFLNDDINPYTLSGLQAQQVNIWKNVLIGQNSDVKRPLSSERATREKWSFENFMNMLCGLTNTAWAIIDGELVIEHMSYFEKGLTYNPLPEVDNILNPYSIQNVAKNKGYMELSNAYRYDKVNMPKFEIMNTDGGREPLNTGLKIEYNTACVNNEPDNNTKETSIACSLDFSFTRTEGRDEGITLISTEFIDIPFIGEINRFYPAVDSFGKHVFNRDFTLQQIVKRWHTWGRMHEQATLNREPWLNLRPFKNVLQNIAFRYKLDSPDKQENPYTVIATEVGYAIIKRVEYRTRGGWLNYELAINPVENAVPPEVVIDWHIHEQATADILWVVNHDMDTEYIMAPVVFDAAGNEIGYNGFAVNSRNQLVLYFSEPVQGEAHFIALNVAQNRLFVASSSGSEWNINHGLNQPPETLALSVIYDQAGQQIMENELEFVDNNNLTIKFTTNVVGTVHIANISDYCVSMDEDISGSDEATFTATVDRVYNKPLVLKANKKALYHFHKIEGVLRTVGFTEDVTAKIIVMEKEK